MEVLAQEAVVPVVVQVVPAVAEVTVVADAEALAKGAVGSAQLVPVDVLVLVPVHVQRVAQQSVSHVQDNVLVLVKEAVRVAVMLQVHRQVDVQAAEVGVALVVLVDAQAVVLAVVQGVVVLLAPDGAVVDVQVVQELAQLNVQELVAKLAILGVARAQ